MALQAGKHLYHADGTDDILEMSEPGELDAAFLPVSGTFTMDLDEAIARASKLNPKVFVPMHYLRVNREEALSHLKVITFNYLLPAAGEEIYL